MSTKQQTFVKIYKLVQEISNDKKRIDKFFNELGKLLKKQSKSELSILDDIFYWSMYDCLCWDLHPTLPQRDALGNLVEKLLGFERAYTGNPFANEKAESQEHLARLPYQEYLKTSHWAQIRSDALKRAEYRCSLCYSNKTLHCHHRTYQRIGREKPSDVIILCEKCHVFFHKNSKADGQKTW